MVDLPTCEAAMPAKKRKPRKNVDREEFYLARRRAGLTVEKAAAMLDVTARTIRNWEGGSSRIPYSAFRLMRLLGGHSLIAKQWEGWSIWRGTLWTPEGRGFEPHELRYISNYLWMAKKWFAEQQAKPKPICSSKIPAAPTSDGSPASRVPPPSSGAGSEQDIGLQVLRPSLQEETTLGRHLESTGKFPVLTGVNNQLNNHANR